MARGPHRRDVTHILSKVSCFLLKSFHFRMLQKRQDFSHTNPQILNVTQQCRCSPMLIFRAWATCGHKNPKQALRVHQSKSHLTVFSLEKSPKLAVFIVWKGFCFFLEYSQTHFSCLFLPMLKRWKNCQFLTKTSDNRFGKIPNF